MARSNRIPTHAFANGLLAQPNEYIRMWLFGRFSITWDTGKPVPRPVALSDIFPAPVSGIADQKDRTPRGTE